MLQNSKDDPSRANILKQATALDGIALPMLLPGIKIHTEPSNVTPIRQLQMAARRQIGSIFRHARPWCLGRASTSLQHCRKKGVMAGTSVQPRDLVEPGHDAEQFSRLHRSADQCSAHYYLNAGNGAGATGAGRGGCLGAARFCGGGGAAGFGGSGCALTTATSGVLQSVSQMS